MADAYAPHRDFIRPAQNVTHPSNIVTVGATFLAAFFAFPVILMAFLPERAQTAFYDAITPVAALAQFAIFGVSAWVFVKALRRVHGRGFWSLIGPYHAAWFDFRKTTVAVGMILLITQVIMPLGSWGEPAEIRNITLWLALLMPAVFVILIQVTTEEIIFRGYLQQQLACLSTNPWVWMGLPSLLFGIWHFWNANSTAEGLVYVFWATLLGLACADLTARTGNLGAAIGLHLANNLAAVLFVGIEGWPMSGLALIIYPYEDPDIISAEIAAVAGIWMAFSMVTTGLSVLIMWLSARISLKR
ncbi:type II CAAX endopeptidase family protein [Cognatiyoonia sp. IB215182]|uniref:CPBP family intramembrane glutamic endopeptidase n=1 Tax=Cognatiyoonia sp. IB215182 TaxID=3097353 RepID=UPI002A17D0E4|nr:type II CAAX endopeptidase family protein [Cognatiyoonia sp. IB215182]MDX8352683.1 type II CAAX endopeptidase family protein [Cognatiyoonia sp. IB215182]